MRNSDIRSRLWRVSAIQLIVAGIVSTVAPLPAAASTPFSSTYRASEGDYRACLSGLTGAGISTNEAAAACAGALYPADLSTCVTRIDGNTAILATDALNTCRQTRRPIDLASCVVNISGQAPEEPIALNVADFCRRSLLPLRFSNCVVGLQGDTLTLTEAMQDCIAAGRRPRDVLPTFVPIDQGIPATPTRIIVPEDEPLSPVR
ncbi:hypothetical protein [Egbenema bharatensis]|uniref:hypothetical protein n=1 Tax=Egbenema bharatensis TaxID=3463334 RepID=UPI003A89871B